MGRLSKPINEIADLMYALAIGVRNAELSRAVHIILPTGSSKGERCNDFVLCGVPSFT